MQVLSTNKLSWLTPSHKTELLATTKFPPHALITSVHGLLFSQDMILMTYVRKRGWDIPGGHIEEGESLGDALLREVWEETTGEIENLQPLAYQRIELLEQPVSNKYPFPVSFQQFFIGTISILHAFVPTDEVSERKLFIRKEMEELPWYHEHKQLYEYAYTIATSK